MVVGGWLAAMERQMWLLVVAEQQSGHTMWWVVAAEQQWAHKCGCWWLVSSKGVINEVAGEW